MRGPASTCPCLRLPHQKVRPTLTVLCLKMIDAWGNKQSGSARASSERFEGTPPKLAQNACPKCPKVALGFCFIRFLANLGLGAVEAGASTRVIAELVGPFESHKA